MLLTYLTTNNLRPRFVMSLISKCVIFIKYAKCLIFEMLYIYAPLIKNSYFIFLPGETFLFQKACLLLTYLTTNSLRKRFVMSLISKFEIFLKTACCVIFTIKNTSTFNKKFHILNFYRGKSFFFKRRVCY